MTPLRIVGAALVLAGLVLAFAPTLLYDPGPAVDTFAQIERRIPWGGLAGLGALLIARTQLRPWTVTLAHVVLWLMVGFLVARLAGLALDGAEPPRQWMWVAVEAVLGLAAGAYLWRRRERGTAR